MKFLLRLFFGFALLLSIDSNSMNISRFIKRTRPSAFGKTHFIIGNHRRHYSAPSLPSSENIVPQLDQRPPIINGSSVHLLDENRLVQSFSTNRHDISSIIVHLLNSAENTITAALFSLTDLRISTALIDAHKRGVKVCVMMDPSNMNQQYSKGEILIKNGIPTYKYDPKKNPRYNKKNKYESLMHQKCMLIDKMVITGSANSTKSAYQYNVETITVIRDLLTVLEHIYDLDLIKTYCTECKKLKK